MLQVTDRFNDASEDLVVDVVGGGGVVPRGAEVPTRQGIRPGLPRQREDQSSLRDA